MSYRFESVSIPGGGSYSKKRLRLRLSRVLTDGKLDFAGDRAERGFRTKEYANFLEPRKTLLGLTRMIDVRGVFEQVVECRPVPTGFDDRFAGLVQGRKVGGEGRGAVVVDAGLLHGSALRVERAGHRITLMVIDSSVYHGGSKDTTFRQSERLTSLIAAHVT